MALAAKPDAQGSRQGEGINVAFANNFTEA